MVTGPAGAGIMAGVDAGPLTPADGRGAPGPSARPDAWERWVVGWHLGFWLLLALAALWAVSSAHLDPAERGSALAVVAVLGLAYGLLIQRGDSRAPPGPGSTSSSRSWSPASAARSAPT